MNIGQRKAESGRPADDGDSSAFHFPLSAFATRLTPPGRGAIATILVGGAEAISIVEGLFTPLVGGQIADRPAGRILVGHWRAGGEEVVVCRRAVDALEVNCHGGQAAVAAILDSLAAAGCKVIDWRDWLRSTAATGIAAAASEDLARASTVPAALILLDQQRGALERALREIAVAIERCDSADARLRIAELVKHSRAGLHLISPFRIVLCGEPNVGKSSLLNRLLGHERAIVAPTPGTTRDVVSANAAFDGWPVELSDTAGLRATTHPIEREGVARSQQQLAQADLAVVVDDAANRSCGMFIPYLAGDSISVCNKVDLLAPGTPRLAGVFYTSAVTGEGIEALIAAIVSRLMPEPPPPGAGVPFRAEHVEALRQIDALLATDCWREALALLETLAGRAGSL